MLGDNLVRRNHTSKRNVPERERRAVPHLRREHERDLIRLWLDTLASRHGVTGYSFDEAFYDYRVGILMMWTYVVIVGGGMAAENERGDNWVSAMVSRSIAAMEDHDCLSLLDRFQTSP